MNDNLSTLLETILNRYESGVSADELAKEYGNELANVDESDFVAAENELVNQGRSVDSLRELCDVHGAVYLAQKRKQEEASVAIETPLSLFRKENDALWVIIDALKAALAAQDWAKIAANLPSLRPLTLHYEEKENLFFPYLVRHGFRAVSKVMWAKDDEVRLLLKGSLALVAPQEVETKAKDVAHLLRESEAMVDKENEILIPLLKKNLSASEFQAIAEEMLEENHPLLSQRFTRSDFGLSETKEDAYSAENGALSLPTGQLSAAEANAILNSLSEELTFINPEGKFMYFNRPSEIAFTRSKAQLGEDVKDCHPAKAIPAVMGVLNKLSSGEEKSIDFALSKNGKKIVNTYLGLHDSNGRYLGCLEITKIL
jgi:DUF438 domain-containing protein